MQENDSSNKQSPNNLRGCDCGSLVMDDQLKTLYDYTKFHIGMYTTLAAIIVGALSKSGGGSNNSDFLPYIGATLICYIFAGICGGLIASSIPAFSSYKEFIQSYISPWDFNGNMVFFSLTAKTLTHLEHFFFWLGTISVIVGIFINYILVKYSVWMPAVSIPLGTIVVIVLTLKVIQKDREYKKSLINK